MVNFCSNVLQITNKMLSHRLISSHKITQALFFPLSDKLSVFLICVADWFAIFIAKMYFRVQLKKNQELEEIEEHERTLRTIDLEEGGPVATSTPKGSKAESVLSAEVKIEEPDLTVNTVDSTVRPEELDEDEEEEEEAVE